LDCFGITPCSVNRKRLHWMEIFLPVKEITVKLLIMTFLLQLLVDLLIILLLNV